MAEKKTVAVIKQNEEAPIPVEVIADSIVKIDAATKKLLNSGLKRETIVILIHAFSGVGKPDIRATLNSLDLLRKEYCTR